jgi:hypothetical protein
MVDNLAVEHVGSDFSTPFSRAHDAGFDGTAIGENVARDLETGVAVLFGWRSSVEGHNENMLDPRWTAVGIAREVGARDAWATSYGDAVDCPELFSGSAPTGVDVSNLLALNSPPSESVRYASASLDFGGRVAADVSSGGTTPAAGDVP